jgi:hypothetical protein
MVNSYLNYLQEDNKQLNEFVVLPLIVLSTKLYKKYGDYKKISKYCSKKDKSYRKECILKYKIRALNKTIIEIKKFKIVCKKWSENIPKCISNVDKQVLSLKKDIHKLKIKLTKL